MPACREVKEMKYSNDLINNTMVKPYQSLLLRGVDKLNIHTLFIRICRCDNTLQNPVSKSIRPMPILN